MLISMLNKLPQPRTFTKGRHLHSQLQCMQKIIKSMRFCHKGGYKSHAKLHKFRSFCVKKSK